MVDLHKDKIKINHKQINVIIKPEICDIKPEICDIKPEICDIKPEICDIKF